MRWEAEKWRKLYRRVDPTWLKLPVLARGLGSELLKYADDDGRVALQADEETGEGLCRVMSAHKSERKLVCELAQKLLNDGYIVREPDAVLIRNFTRAQCRSSNAERQARYRDRHRDDPDSGARNVTAASPCDVDSNVTRNAERSGRVTETFANEVTDRALPLSLSENSSGSLSADLQKEVPVTASARDSTSHAAPGGQAVLFGPVESAKKPRRRGPETAIPDGWAPSQEHFDLAQELGLTDDDLRREATKFRSDALARDKRFVRWGQAFNTWLNNAAEYQRQKRVGGAPSRGPQPQPGRAWIDPAEKNPNPASPEEQETPLV